MALTTTPKFSFANSNSALGLGSILPKITFPNGSAAPSTYISPVQNPLVESGNISGNITKPFTPPIDQQKSLNDNQAALNNAKVGQAVKLKYPGKYDDADDNTLGAAVLQKYPQYGNSLPSSTGIGQLTPKPQVPVQGSSISPAEGVGLVAAGIPATIAASAGAGTLLKDGGKLAYGLTIPRSKDEASAVQAYKAGLTDTKPITTVDTALRSSPLVSPLSTLSRDPFRGVTGLSPFNMAGSKSKIGVDAAANAKAIFTKTINPLFDKADEQGLKIPLDGLFQSAIDFVDKNKQYDPATKEGTKNAIIDIWNNYKEALQKQGGGDSLSLRDLQNSKSNIQGFTSPKVMKGEISPSDLQNARGAVGTTMKDKLHNTIQDKFGADSASKYADYANYKELAEQGVKDMTDAGFKGGFGNFGSTVADKIFTPVTTNIGKTAFNIGKALQTPGKATLKLLEAGKGVIQDLAKGGKLFSLLEDGTLIPGSPSNSAMNQMLASPSDYVQINNGPLKGYSIGKDNFQKINGKNVVVGPDGRVYDDKGDMIGKFD